jgi:hypothetical protein
VTGDHADSEAQATIPDIRYALLNTSLEEPLGRTARPAHVLAEETSKIAAWRQACRYTEVGRALPSLITDLHVAAAERGADDRPAALRSLVQAAQVTTLLVKSLGAVDLAWTAAERGHEAAVLLGDPLYIAAASFARTQALVGLGAYHRAGVIARRASEMLHDAEAGVLEVLGTSILTDAFCGSVLGTEDPEAAIEEAASLAERLTNGGAGDNSFFLAFSRTNVELWRISIALESEDPVTAAEVGSRVSLDDIPAKSRKVAFLIDYARALHGLRGRDGEVVTLLRKAERLGPARTVHSLWAREMVTEMLLRARRDSGGVELRTLADRMGLLHAV